MTTTLPLLMYEFFLTGLFAVGGGLATLPFLKDIGRRRGWYTTAQLGDMVAASQCVPGPLGTNMSAYVGWHVGGLPGALLSALSLMLPTILVDLLVSVLMKFLKKIPWLEPLIERFMQAIRPASAGLICAAAFSLLSISLVRPEAVWDLRAPLDWLGNFDWRCIALYAVLLPFVFWKKTKKVHPAVWIGAGAVVGVAVGL